MNYKIMKKKKLVKLSYAVKIKFFGMSIIGQISKMGF